MITIITMKGTTVGVTPPEAGFVKLRCASQSVTFIRGEMRIGWSSAGAGDVTRLGAPRPDGHHLQVLARRHQGSVPGPVRPAHQIRHRAREGLRPGRTQALERFDRLTEDPPDTSPPA